ncbi:unnamed protein product, partial [Ectocarpus sp. 12 AP-2014]
APPPAAAAAAVCRTLSPSSHAGTRSTTVLAAVSGGVRRPARLLWLSKRRYVDYSFQYFSLRKRERGRAVRQFEFTTTPRDTRTQGRRESHQDARSDATHAGNVQVRGKKTRSRANDGGGGSLLLEQEKTQASSPESDDDLFSFSRLVLRHLVATANRDHQSSGANGDNERGRADIEPHGGHLPCRRLGLLHGHRRLGHDGRPAPLRDRAPVVRRRRRSAGRVRAWRVLRQPVPCAVRSGDRGRLHGLGRQLRRAHPGGRRCRQVRLQRHP